MKVHWRLMIATCLEGGEGLECFLRQSRDSCLINIFLFAILVTKDTK